MDNGRGSGRPSVALVIGSGGIKCAAALGVWKLLQREGIDVSVAVASSGGFPIQRPR
jgi:NTE family protein